MANQSFALFNNLELDLQPHLGSALTPESSVAEVAAKTLMSSILMKHIESEKPDASLKAYEKFYAMNERCATYTPDVSTILSSEMLSYIRGYFANWYDSFSDFFTIRAFIDHMDLGSGTNIGSSDTSYYGKVYGSALSAYNNRQYQLYLSCIKASTPLQKSAFVQALLANGGPTMVQGSISYSVPKNADIRRLIWQEASIPMMQQKVLDKAFLFALHKDFNIDMTMQNTLNGQYAIEGSLDSDNGFCTIDLSSFSDTLALKLLDFFDFDFRLKDLINLTRASSGVHEGQVVEFNMICGMGNGYCSSLQTLILSSIVKAAYTVLGLNSEKFGVFGDDIIIVKKAWRAVTTFLSDCGFIINDKSYNSGYFRESCGVDAWKGKDVRGVYCTSIKTLQDYYSLINRLNVWSEKTGLPLPNTIQYLFSLIPKAQINFVPLYESDEAGIRVPKTLLLAWIDAHPFFRYCGKLYGLEHYRAYRPAIDSVDISVLSDNLRFIKSGKNKLAFVPDGIYVSSLKGKLRTDTLVTRQMSLRYRFLSCKGPDWDLCNSGTNAFLRLGENNHRCSDSYSLIIGMNMKFIENIA